METFLGVVWREKWRFGVENRDILYYFWLFLKLISSIKRKKALCCPPETVTTLLIGLLQYKMKN